MAVDRTFPVSMTKVHAVGIPTHVELECCNDIPLWSDPIAATNPPHCQLGLTEKRHVAETHTPFEVKFVSHRQRRPADELLESIRF